MQVPGAPKKQIKIALFNYLLILISGAILFTEKIKRSQRMQKRERNNLCANGSNENLISINQCTYSFIIENLNV